MCLASMVGHLSRHIISRLQCHPRVIHSRQCQCHNSSRTIWTLAAVRWVCTQPTSNSSRQCPTSMAVTHNNRLRSRWGCWDQASLVACRCQPEEVHRWWGRQPAGRWRECQCNQGAASIWLPEVVWCHRQSGDRESRWDRLRLGPWTIQCHHQVKCHQDSTQTMDSKASSEHQIQTHWMVFIPSKRICVTSC